MPDRIKPRPIFREAMTKLESARCPECGRAYDPVQADESYCSRMVPLHCSWCGERMLMIREYRVWLRQDAEVRRELLLKRSLRPSARA